MLLSADGKTTGIVATLSLDQQYLSLVTQRDNLRLIRDTEGLSLQQNYELETISAEFLDYRTKKAAEDHSESGKGAQAYGSISRSSHHISRRSRYDYCRHDRLYQKRPNDFWYWYFVIYACNPCLYFSLCSLGYTAIGHLCYMSNSGIRFSKLDRLAPYGYFL